MKKKDADKEETKKKDEEEEEENKWVIIVNHRENAVSKDVPLLWVQGPVYVKASTHFIHKEGAFFDCVNFTECLLNGLASLVTGLPDSDGHCHAAGSSEYLKPVSNPNPRSSSYHIVSITGKRNSRHYQVLHTSMLQT